MAEFVDVSNNNGPVNWTKAAGTCVGAWLKATEGVTFVDAYFDSHRAACKAVGVHPGAYHFARPDLHSGTNGAVAEANHFCDILVACGDAELRPALDFETLGKPGDDLSAWAKAFNGQCRTRGIATPLFYSYPWFIQNMNPLAPIGNGLWYADYGPDDGSEHPTSPPPPWKNILIHQYTSKGRVAGVVGYVDRDSAQLSGSVFADAIKAQPWIDVYAKRRTAAQTELPPGQIAERM